MYYEHYTEVNLFDICDDVFHEKKHIEMMSGQKNV